MTYVTDTGVRITDLKPTKSDMLADVVEGLGADGQKTIPSKYLYDDRGSRLFEEITDAEDYYPTRTEMSIFDTHADEIGSVVGPAATVIELGSGASLKIRKLLGMLDAPGAYVPVEISIDQLERAVDDVSSAFPDVAMHGICADFTSPFQLPDLAERKSSPRLVFFPGSTIGNFAPSEAESILGTIAGLLRDGRDAAIIGADLEKDPRTLRRAYDDGEGVTAAFNLNLIERLNRELDADFDAEQFQHEARYNDGRKRIEMHLRAETAQTVTIADQVFELKPGESIHTENSHKYSPERFAAMAERAGLTVERYWTDEDRLFSVQLVRKRV